jgi:hypothetical protein
LIREAFDFVLSETFSLRERASRDERKQDRHDDKENLREQMTKHMV